MLPQAPICKVYCEILLCVFSQWKKFHAFMEQKVQHCTHNSNFTIDWTCSVQFTALQHVTYFWSTPFYTISRPVYYVHCLFSSVCYKKYEFPCIFCSPRRFSHLPKHHVLQQLQFVLSFQNIKSFATVLNVTSQLGCFSFWRACIRTPKGRWKHELLYIYSIYIY